MSRWRKKSDRFFEKCGQQGGRKRAQRLSAAARSAIASLAAHARWGKKPPSLFLMPSVRLDRPRLDDPTYIEELLSEGSFGEWRKIYQEIANQPFGATAEALERVLSGTEIYGITPLWKGILRTVQGNFT